MEISTQLTNIPSSSSDEEIGSFFAAGSSSRLCVAKEEKPKVSSSIKQNPNKIVNAMPNSKKECALDGSDDENPYGFLEMKKTSKPSSANPAASKLGYKWDALKGNYSLVRY